MEFMIVKPIKEACLENGSLLGTSVSWSLVRWEGCRVEVLSIHLHALFGHLKLHGHVVDDLLDINEVVG